MSDPVASPTRRHRPRAARRRTYRLRAAHLAIVLAVAALVTTWLTGFVPAPWAASQPPTHDDALRNTAFAVMPVVIPWRMSGKVL